MAKGPWEGGWAVCPLPVAGGVGGDSGAVCAAGAVLCGCRGAQGLQRDPAAVCFSQRVLSRVQVGPQGSCSSTASDTAYLFFFLFSFPLFCWSCLLVQTRRSSSGKLASSGFFFFLLLPSLYVLCSCISREEQRSPRSGLLCREARSSRSHFHLPAALGWMRCVRWDLRGVPGSPWVSMQGVAVLYGCRGHRPFLLPPPPPGGEGNALQRPLGWAAWGAPGVPC